MNLLVDDLLSRYRRTFREEHYGGIWRDIFDQRQRALHSVFMNGLAEEAEAIIANPATNYLHYGFDGTIKGCDRYSSNNTALLRKLSEALGAERLVNPELRTSLRYKLGTLRRRYSETADDILARIDQVRSGIDFPNPVPGETGTITKRGVASYRAIQAIYQASLLKGRVLEIGGGLGRTAYYASRFGVTDYTIVDLPFTGISQGYFLGRTLGTHGVKLLSPDEFFESDETYDVALNVDSLTEMSRAMAERYATAIKRRARRFISINHEANAFVVRDLFAGCVSRHQYWLRAGYVEETYLSGL